VICEAGEAGQGFAIEKQFTNEEKSWNASKNHHP